MNNLYRTSFSLLLVLFSLFLPTARLAADQPGASPVKVFILIGQSNMEGKGLVSPASKPGTLEYTVANDDSGAYQFLSDGAGGFKALTDTWIHYETKAGPLLTGDLREVSVISAPDTSAILLDFTYDCQMVYFTFFQCRTLRSSGAAIRQGHQGLMGYVPA